MPSATPTPTYSFIEPRAATAAPRRWVHTWEVNNLPADAPGTIAIWLGELAPWNMFPLWTEIRSLKIGVYSEVVGGTLYIHPDFTMGLTSGTGYVTLERKSVVTATGYFSGASWDNLNLLTTGQCVYVDSGKRSPTFYCYFVDNTAADDINIYMDGVFYEPFDNQMPQPISVEGYRWPLARRS